MSTAAQAQAGRDRAREARLKAAGERQRQLDPNLFARDKRIDEATVDLELACEARAEAEWKVAFAEASAAAAIERLLGERLSAADVARSSAGSTRPRVPRLRQARAAEAPAADDAAGEG